MDTTTYNVYAGYYELFITDKQITEGPQSKYFQGSFHSMDELNEAMQNTIPGACAIFVDKDLFNDFFEDNMPQYDFGENQCCIDNTFVVANGAITDVQKIVFDED